MEYSFKKGDVVWMCSPVSKEAATDIVKPIYDRLGYPEDTPHAIRRMVIYSKELFGKELRIVDMEPSDYIGLNDVLVEYSVDALQIWVHGGLLVTHRFNPTPTLDQMFDEFG